MKSCLRSIPSSHVIFWTLIASAALVFTVSVNASMIGDTVSCSSPSFVCTPTSAVVSKIGDIEFEAKIGGVVPAFDIDLGRDEIILMFSNNTGIAFSAGASITLSSLDWIDPVTGNVIPGGITGFTLQAIDTTFSSGDVTFLSDSVSFDIGPNSWNPGSSATVLLEFSQVPVPASLTLFVSALAGLGVFKWRMRRK
jgi:hypothetical protein